MIGSDRFAVDENIGSNWNLVIKSNDVFIAHHHTTSRSGGSQSVFVIGAVDVDVASKRVDTLPRIFARLESAQPKDATGDQIALLNLFVELPKEFSGGHAGEEDGTGLGLTADFLFDAVKPVWSPRRIFNAGRWLDGGRDRIFPANLFSVAQKKPLQRDTDIDKDRRWRY